jgi:hypothetical protein
MGQFKAIRVHKVTKRATTISVPLATKAKKDIIQAMKLISDVEDLTISLPPQVGAGGADEESTCYRSNGGDH